MSNVIQLKTKFQTKVTPVTPVEEIAPVVTIKAPRNAAKKNSKKAKIFSKILQKSVHIVGLMGMICGVTSYLVYQNYEFFTAITQSSHTIALMGYTLSVPALMNSIIAELILLTSAAYTCSRKVTTKVLAWVLMLGMIGGLGVFMHASIDNGLTGNSDYVQSLKQQKKDALSAKENYEIEKNALDPLKWKTRRESMQQKINIERANIIELDQKINSAKDVSSNNLQGIIVYNSILRIAAMIINALLAHTLISQLLRKKDI